LVFLGLDNRLDNWYRSCCLNGIASRWRWYHFWSYSCCIHLYLGDLWLCNWYWGSLNCLGDLSYNLSWCSSLVLGNLSFFDRCCIESLSHLFLGDRNLFSFFLGFFFHLVLSIALQTIPQPTYRLFCLYS
jgi:hypothetical protein